MGYLDRSCMTIRNCILEMLRILDVWEVGFKISGPTSLCAVVIVIIVLSICSGVVYTSQSTTQRNYASITTLQYFTPLFTPVIVCGSYISLVRIT